MVLAQALQHDLDLGTYRSPSDQEFRIVARLFEMSHQYDYWLATYDAQHEKWGHMRFTLTIPKRIAQNIEEASRIVTGTAAVSVRAWLDVANDGGRPMMPVFSVDGWVLI